MPSICSNDHCALLPFVSYTQIHNKSLTNLYCIEITYDSFKAFLRTIIPTFEEQSLNLRGVSLSNAHREDVLTACQGKFILGR